MEAEEQHTLTCTHHSWLEAMLVETLTVFDEGDVGPEQNPSSFAL